jgi:hypothetical protein
MSMRHSTATFIRRLITTRAKQVLFVCRGAVLYYMPGEHLLTRPQPVPDREQSEPWNRGKPANEVARAVAYRTQCACIAVALGVPASVVAVQQCCLTGYSETST